jgi:hypothetical protein
VLRKLLHEYLFKLVVGLAVTGTITAFALINKYWSWPNAVVGGVMLLGGVLYLMDRLGIGPSLKSRVRDWLDSSGYNIRTIEDSNEFHFTLTDPVGIVTDVLQMKPNSPVLIVSAGHKAAAPQLATFKGKSEADQQGFWRSVRLELLRYRISFSDLTLEGEGVSFSESVMPSSGLSGTEFLKRVLFVRSAARLYWELLANLNPVIQPIPMPDFSAPAPLRE